MEQDNDKGASGAASGAAARRGGGLAEVGPWGFALGSVALLVLGAVVSVIAVAATIGSVTGKAVGRFENHLPEDFDLEAAVGAFSDTHTLDLHIEQGEDDDEPRLIRLRIAPLERAGADGADPAPLSRYPAAVLDGAGAGP